MILVNYEGQPIGGNMSRPANAAGFLIHSAVHKEREDVIAACHTHSPYGKAWSSFSRPLEMLNQDVTYFYGDAQAVYKAGFLVCQGVPDILTVPAGVRWRSLHRRRRQTSRFRPWAERQRADPSQPRLVDRWIHGG